MPKIKLTKGELKRQRDSLKQFEHYLPVLQLKKQQIQIEIDRIRKALARNKEEIDVIEGEIAEWAGLLNESRGLVDEWVRVKEVRTSFNNIAGIDIPVFQGIEFKDIAYDFYTTPLWVDFAVRKIRELVTLLEEGKLIRRQLEILAHELRITTQRVNLFEKVKIPDCRENIRIIRIYLGDQQTNAVGRSKMAKNKIQNLVLEEALL